jgi:hypothetical protein
MSTDERKIMKLNVDDLVARKLVKKTKSTVDGEQLSILKYTRKVFYDNLWHLDDRLLECRGTVVDQYDNVVVLPFRKVFNRYENGTSLDEYPDDDVLIIEKINGFMAAATKRAGHDELLISTTGSLNSNFVGLAKFWLAPLTSKVCDVIPPGCTMLFEINDPNDPHIVAEHPGAYLIGVRSTNNGNMMSEKDLDQVVRFINVELDKVGAILRLRRPRWYSIHKSELDRHVEIFSKAEREGLMVLPQTDDPIQGSLMKIKTPMYLVKKFLMRMGPARVEKVFSDPQSAKATIDEEFYDLIDWLVSEYTKQDWIGMDEAARRVVIERYYGVV